MKGKPMKAIETQDLSAGSTANAFLDGFIHEADAADFLCQSVRTIQKWRVTGAGPQFYKFGRSVRYRRRELCEWVEDRRKAHTSQ